MPPTILASPRIRTTAQLFLLAVAAVIVVHGLWGPQLGPRNLATVLTWIHYRGLLLGVLLAAGNAFCGACPMILVRDVARRLRPPSRRWPSFLRGKWLAAGLFAAILFAYELFDLWGLPAATAWLVVGYFAAAVVVDTSFTGAAFCRHLCPVGQFSFVASTLSPLEIQPRDRDVCRHCTTVDCIRGRRDPVAPAVVVKRGCELALFVPAKVGNLNCTFCLDCVRACPYDNVTLGTRVPAEELADDRRRSGIGRLPARTDFAVLAAVFAFGALLNAFAMTGPGVAVEREIGRTLGTTSEAVTLSVLFVLGLVVLPAALCLSAAWVSQPASRPARPSIRRVAARYVYGLVPFGVGVWAAHYAFHFLTAVGTIVPVAQSAVIDAFGRAALGQPDWRWLGMRPGSVFPLQIGAVLLGTLGSLFVVQNIAAADAAGSRRASVPWLLLIVALAAAAVWILAQPMEMRGTSMGG